MNSSPAGFIASVTPSLNEDDEVARMQREGFLLERGLLEQTEHDAAGFKTPHASR